MTKRDTDRLHTLKSTPRGGHHTYSGRDYKNYTCIVCEKRFWELMDRREHQEAKHTGQELSEALEAKRTRIEN